MTPTTSTRYGASVLSIFLLAMGFAGLAGCRHQKTEKEHRTMTGTVTNIDEATGKVAMTFYSKKNQKDVPIEGAVTPQTEILINGRVSKLGDVKIGEQVVVTGYLEKTGPKQRIVATKVQIERSDWAKSSQPATQAATKPASAAPAAQPAKP
jgi:hypothetical protein